jgi:hypothetical protein
MIVSFLDALKEDISLAKAYYAHNISSKDWGKYLRQVNLKRRMAGKGLRWSSAGKITQDPPVRAISSRSTA